MASWGVGSAVSTGEGEMTDSSARGAVERYARRDRSKRDGPGKTGSARSRSGRDGRARATQNKPILHGPAGSGRPPEL